MGEGPSQKFRGEWHTYQGGSTVVEARSAAEAVEKEKQSPFSGTDFDLHEWLDNVFVLPTDAPVVFLFPMPKPEKTPVAGAKEGRIRKYVVSATYRRIYAGDVLAFSAEEAQRQARENPELWAEWKLIKELEHVVASAVPEEQ